MMQQMFIKASTPLARSFVCLPGAWHGKPQHRTIYDLIPVRYDRHQLVDDGLPLLHLVLHERVVVLNIACKNKGPSSQEVSSWMRSKPNLQEHDTCIHIYIYIYWLDSKPYLFTWRNTGSFLGKWIHFFWIFIFSSASKNEYSFFSAYSFFRKMNIKLFFWIFTF